MTLNGFFLYTTKKWFFAIFKSEFFKTSHVLDIFRATSLVLILLFNRLAAYSLCLDSKQQFFALFQGERMNVLIRWRIGKLLKKTFIGDHRTYIWAPCLNQPSLWCLNLTYMLLVHFFLIRENSGQKRAIQSMKFRI